MLALPPSTLKAAPVEPARVPAVAAQPLPPMLVSNTPLVPPVELRLANVPLRFPVVRLSAVVPETLTLLPIVIAPKLVVFVMPVVGPVMVTPASDRLVNDPWSEMPVVPRSEERRVGK